MGHDNDNQSGDDGGERDPLSIAQDLAYDAWEEPYKKDRIRLANKALSISDLCADAYVILAEEEINNLVEKKAFLEKGVAAGEKAIGAERFKREVGDFWGLLDTRPYMRARAALAQCLWELGERDAAIGHLQDMLRLNPNDNQGMRYILSGWLLVISDHDSLESLLAAYDENSVYWNYNEALLAFRKSGASAQAREALKTAFKHNPHILPLLTGERKMPKTAPYAYSPGSTEEAVLYVQNDNAENWSATKGAIEWLHNETKNLRP